MRYYLNLKQKNHGKSTVHYRGHFSCHLGNQFPGGLLYGRNYSYPVGHCNPRCIAASDPWQRLEILLTQPYPSGFSLVGKVLVLCLHMDPFNIHPGI